MCKQYIIIIFLIKIINNKCICFHDNDKSINIIFGQVSENSLACRIRPLRKLVNYHSVIYGEEERFLIIYWIHVLFILFAFILVCFSSIICVHFVSECRGGSDDSWLWLQYFHFYSLHRLGQATEHQTNHN